MAYLEFITYKDEFLLDINSDFILNEGDLPNCCCDGGTPPPPEPQCGTCTYKWDGISWNLISSNCATLGGTLCVCPPAPLEDGTVVNQEIILDCIPA